MANYNLKHYCLKGAVKAIGVLSVVAVGLLGRGVIAQNLIVPDDSLGNNSSVVTPVTASIDSIEGGAISESNLFHSFQEFNIAEGKGAYFFTAPNNIQNIFSRVTGNSLSEIFGTLGTIGNSTPDLWLINPNGIVFGPASRLDVGGSFIASTANAAQIGENITFRASSISENPQILTINSSALLFNQGASGRIENQSQSSIVSPTSDAQRI